MFSDIPWHDLLDCACLGDLERTGALLRAHAWLESALKDHLTQLAEKEGWGGSLLRELLKSRRFEEQLKRAGIPENLHLVLRRGLRTRITHAGCMPPFQHVLNDIRILRTAVAILQDKDSPSSDGCDNDNAGTNQGRPLSLSSRAFLLGGAFSSEPLEASKALSITASITLSFGILHARACLD